MRIYDEEKLKYDTREELVRKLNMVKTNPDLTEAEKTQNINVIETALNGGAQCTRQQQILDDIKLGEADISDMGSSY